MYNRFNGEASGRLKAVLFDAADGLEVLYETLFNFDYYGDCLFDNDGMSLV